VCSGGRTKLCPSPKMFCTEPYCSEVGVVLGVLRVLPAVASGFSTASVHHALDPLRSGDVQGC
jgi:hypothetical protein